MAKTTYDESNIERFSGLSAVRKKPTVYVGAMDHSGLWTILREPADNCVDQALAERNKLAHIIFDSEPNTYWVVDSGEGIPVGQKEFEDERGKKEKMSTLYVVSGLTHGGGNFSGDVISRGCFTGDTKIRLLDGRIVTMKWLFDLWKTDQTLIPCYCWDLKKDKLAFSNISHVQETFRTKELVEVTTSTGKKIRCTPDHPFYIRTSSGINKVRADHLNSDDSCVALHLNTGSVVESYNFSIVAVRKLKLKEAVPVYDITVDKYHNFFIEPGVLVSNTHGLGIKCTNALSTSFQIWTFRDGRWWSIVYAKGKLIKDAHKSSAPVLPHGIKTVNGTVVKFSPDLSLFTPKSKISMSDVVEWCTLTSYLVPGLKICLTNSKGSTKTFISKLGAVEFIDKRVAELQCTITGKPFTLATKEVDVAVAFSDAEGANLVYAYTNGLRNQEGGEHLRAFHDALMKSLAPFRGKLEYTVNDLKEGLIGLVNYKISAPQFNNQTKDKLLDQRVYAVAVEQMLEELNTFWTKNKALAKQIVTRASELRKRTSDFLKDKKLIKNVKTAMKGLSAKLSDVGNSKTPIMDRDLYLCEGDSASGTSKIARHKDFQAIFALRGKPLNVMETTKDKVNGNREIAGIFAGIGLDLSAENPIAKIRFGKIIFLTDADVDGAHINTLLLTLFWKYLPDLYKEGRIYILLSPEYMTKLNGKIYFASSVQALYKKCGTEKIDIRHIKGWGELDSTDMQPIAFDVATRRLAKILPPKDKNGVLEFEALMGKKAVYRQKLLNVCTSGAVEKVESEP